LLAPVAGPIGEAREWSEELLKRLYADSAESTIAILVALAKRPGEWISTEELAPAIGPDATWRSVAGALSPVTKRQKAYGQEAWPFELRQDSKTGRWHYRMSERTARIVLGLHEHVEGAMRDLAGGDPA
jgi:hypothetical protein